MCVRMWLLLVGVATSTALSGQILKPSFSVVSVRPVADLRIVPGPTVFPGGRFYRPGDTVAGLIAFAYDVMQFQVVVGPQWIGNSPFEIDARADGDVSAQQMRLMVQSLLEARFGLVLRREQRTMAHSVLVVARSDGRLGAGLTKCKDPQNLPPPQRFRVPKGGVPITGTCREISAIAANVGYALGMPALDKTGLTGLWNFQLVFLQSQPRALGLGARSAPDTEDVPPLPIALEEQLGLKLESARGPVDVLVIESARKPTEN